LKLITSSARLDFGDAVKPGKCALCRNEALLVDSHLLPRALYKSLRNIDPDNENPLFLNSNAFMRTSRQISDYLLCKDCERRFEEGGEGWLLANRFHWPDAFPLQDSLRSGPRIQSLETGGIIQAGGLEGIDVNRIVYFATSVFWRAAVHTWRAPYGGGPVALDFGPKYTEELRRFLLGQAEFPADAVLLVRVFSKRSNWANSMVFPYGERRETFHQYRFIVPGIVFDLLLGMKFPPEAPESCFLRGPCHPVFWMDDDRAIIQDALKLLRTAVPKGRSFEQYR
jgi:hypothetical protein